MRKIMFSDKYGLTQAVLEMRKTMTRRIVPCEVHPFDTKEDLIKYSRYKIGEVVAIAQAYKDIPWFSEREEYCSDMPEYTAGWTNKMFVAAKYMPHHLFITEIKVERLQDISNEDCLREGVYMRTEKHPRQEFEPEYTFGEGDWHAKYPIAAFVALYEKVSGNGTWERNPYCFCYTFELID